MKLRPIAAAFVVAISLLLGVVVERAYGCSPPFERPTIKALGPAQLVVVGRVGEQVPGGRRFYVDRWFNGGDPITPIVIAFKEGEAIGDCSYPVATGEQKIIAPVRQPDGTLYADLGTLQADPATAEGQRYVAEALALFGPGVVPVPSSEPPAEEGVPSTAILVIAVAAVVVLAGTGFFLRRRTA
jgi:hypothetical protein